MISPRLERHVSRLEYLLSRVFIMRIILEMTSMTMSYNLKTLGRQRVGERAEEILEATDVTSESVSSGEFNTELDS